MTKRRADKRPTRSACAQKPVQYLYRRCLARDWIHFSRRFLLSVGFECHLEFITTLHWFDFIWFVEFPANALDWKFPSSIYSTYVIRPIVSSSNWPPRACLERTDLLPLPWFGRKNLIKQEAWRTTKAVCWHRLLMSRQYSISEALGGQTGEMLSGRSNVDNGWLYNGLFLFLLPWWRHITRMMTGP